jgi:hypothetical protein
MNINLKKKQEKKTNEKPNKPPKQEGHDGHEVAHLYKGPWSRASLNPRAFI